MDRRCVGTRTMTGRRAAGLLFAFLLSACTVTSQGERGTSRYVLGLVRIQIPDRQGELSAMSVKALGVGWDQGPFLGWRDASWILADPAQCQLVVIVRSGVEADNAAKVLGQLKGEGLCVADFSNTLRPPAR